MLRHVNGTVLIVGKHLGEYNSRLSFSILPVERGQRQVQQFRAFAGVRAGVVMGSGNSPVQARLFSRGNHED